jgi:hypothetical protein
MVCPDFAIFLTPAAGEPAIAVNSSSSEDNHGKA